VSIPPRQSGDPALAHFTEAIAGAPHLETIVYLSTIGVYGDHGGDWVDETTPAAPVSERSRERLNAEQAWAALGAHAGKSVAVLRLAGIYGPGQNALLQVARGSARRIDKAGQFFNRIHVADIAQAIEAAFERGADGVFNVTDDDPTPQGVPVTFAAELLGVAPPPEIPFAEAARSMTPMGLSFYGESKRVRNVRLKRELGVTLRYPSYREGLRTLFAAGDARSTEARAT
jgi:nucleoside-diphosphate-sugar epimerase